MRIFHQNSRRPEQNAPAFFPPEKNMPPGREFAKGRTPSPPRIFLHSGAAAWADLRGNPVSERKMPMLRCMILLFSFLLITLSAAHLGRDEQLVRVLAQIGKQNLSLPGAVAM